LCQVAEYDFLARKIAQQSARNIETSKNLHYASSRRFTGNEKLSAFRKRKAAMFAYRELI
jgi:hypothetical protein